jgi:hypothetical protein
VKSHGVTDETLERSLGLFVGMVAKVLDEPERWLVDDDDGKEPSSLPARALDAVRDRAVGKVNPGDDEWPQQPLQERLDWWVDRIGVAAGLAAAAPRVAGALSDRFPLQAALGASASGLAVCAVARECGVLPPTEWVPLLGKVLFNRGLSTKAPVPPPEESEQSLRDPEDEAVQQSSLASALARGARRSARTLWRLATAFRDVQHLLDERPRGRLLARAVAKVPVVGLAGGWLDERGAIRKAAKETSALIHQTP